MALYFDGIDDGGHINVESLHFDNLHSFCIAISVNIQGDLDSYVNTVASLSISNNFYDGHTSEYFGVGNGYAKFAWGTTFFGLTEVDTMLKFGIDIEKDVNIILQYQANIKTVHFYVNGDLVKSVLCDGRAFRIRSIRLGTGDTNQPVRRPFKFNYVKLWNTTIPHVKIKEYFS